MSLAAAILVITNVIVIDGTGAAPGAPQTVLVRDGRIEALGNPKIPANAQRIDGSGKFLIPGLWDMHVHVLARPDEYFAKLLAHGITGIRNMHLESPDSLREVVNIRREVESGKREGPRVLANGPIIDGPRPVWPASIRLGDAATTRNVANLLKREGADFLKVYDFLPRDAYFALAAEAKRLHLPLSGHVPIWVTAEEAARSGQRSIEHLSGVFEACTANGQLDRELKQAANLWALAPKQSAAQLKAVVERAAASYDDSICQPLFHVFAEKRVWHCPTLVVLGDLRKPALAVVRGLHAAGVGLLAGTDAGTPDADPSLVEPGPSLHRELELLVEAGLTPMETLQAATRNAADYLGRLKSAGTVEKGKVADLVLLDGNPLEDIRNTRRIAAVVVRGALYGGVRPAP